MSVLREPRLFFSGCAGRKMDFERNIFAPMFEQSFQIKYVVKYHFKNLCLKTSENRVFKFSELSHSTDKGIFLLISMQHAFFPGGLSLNNLWENTPELRDTEKRPAADCFLVQFVEVI